MDLVDIGEYKYTLTSLDRINVLLGKNGCGKSYLLRQIEQALRGRAEYGIVRYISPERGGFPQYEAGIEQNVSANPNWLSDTRRQNQTPQFRQQSAAQFRRLETRFLRELERSPQLRADASVRFDTTVERINSLLDRVELRRADPAFQIVSRHTDTVVQPQEISSGEAELISISLECLMFEKECDPGKQNILLFDEPDVHLHPDLQSRLARFIAPLAQQASFTLIVATHSTSLLAALSREGTTNLALMRYGGRKISFSPVDETHRTILPVFGAHPLSNVFNEAPILLVEGDDDQRVWQQAIRSSLGCIRAYPCSVDGVNQLTQFETRAASIIQSVYDNAIGYSIRDRDDTQGELADVGPIKRMKLSCHSIENLLLTDDVIRDLALTWDELCRRLQAWIASNTNHPHIGPMRVFEAGGFDRANADLKDIRNDILGLLGTNKPWEVVVGQAIARTLNQARDSLPYSVHAFLGPRIVAELLSP